MKSRESWRAIEFSRQRAEMMISRVDIFTRVVGTSGANFLLDDSTCSHFRTLHDAYIHAQVLLIPNGRIVHLRPAASERIFSYTSLAKLQRPYPPNKTSKLKNDEKKQGGGSKWGRRRKRAKEGKRKLKKKNANAAILLSAWCPLTASVKRTPVKLLRWRARERAVYIGRVTQETIWGVKNINNAADAAAGKGSGSLSLSRDDGAALRSLVLQYKYIHIHGIRVDWMKERRRRGGRGVEGKER